MDSLLNYKTYAGCFLIGALVVLAITPAIIRLARRIGALDHPNTRKVHSEVRPLLGGLAIFVGVWVPLMLLSFWDNLVTQRLAESWPMLVQLFLAGLAMLALGAWDDKVGLHAWWKLAVQVPVAVLLVGAGVSFGALTVPGWGSVELGWLGPLVTVLWIVGVTNALNIIDGIDGLASGVAFFISLTSAIAALTFGNALLALVLFSMAGACLGFLKYNFNPARIFLGDTGSLFLGMTLAVVSVMANAKGTLAASLFVPLLALGYPIIDTLLTMARRSLQGKSWFKGDRGHIHHRLLALGLNHGQAALVLYGVCVLFCLLALGALLDRTSVFAGGLVVVCGAVGTLLWKLGFGRYLSPSTVQRERELYRKAQRVCEEAKHSLAGMSDPRQITGLLLEVCRGLGVRRVDLVQPVLGQTSALEVHWSDGALGEGAGALRLETFRFDKTGLTATVGLAGSGADEGLRLEYLALLSEVFYTAAQRLDGLLAANSSVKNPALPAMYQIQPSLVT